MFYWRVAGQVTGGPFFIADATARFSATGLPPGVVVNPLTGVLSGAPEAARLLPRSLPRHLLCRSGTGNGDAVVNKRF